jgi:predicted phosphodiesterase
MKKYFWILLFLLGVLYGQTDNKKSITIGIITDVQYCDCNDSGSRNYRASLSKLEDCIKYFNSIKPDFITHLGDIIDHKFSSYDSVMKRFHKSVIPVNYVIGNHDYNINKKYKDEVLGKLGLKNSYYSKSYGDWQILFLNGDELNSDYPGNKALKKETRKVFWETIKKKKFNFFPWNSGISSTQFTWIRTELDKANRSGKKVLLMSHFPIYPFAFHNLRNDDELLSIISQYNCVKAYFCGHNHEGGYGFKDGIHFINFKGMVESGDTPSYAKVTLTQDSIFVEGHGEETSRKLKIY